MNTITKTIAVSFWNYIARDPNHPYHNKFDELPESIQKKYLDTASNVLKSLEKEGFVLVPKEPSEETIQQHIRFYKEQKLLFECKAKEAIQSGLFDIALLHLIERKELAAKINTLEILCSLRERA